MSTIMLTPPVYSQLCRMRRRIVGSVSSAVALIRPRSGTNCAATIAVVERQVQYRISVPRLSRAGMFSWIRGLIKHGDNLALHEHAAAEVVHQRMSCRPVVLVWKHLQP